jgi:hypothetical protein
MAYDDDERKLPYVDRIPSCNEGAVVKRVKMIDKPISLV